MNRLGAGIVGFVIGTFITSTVWVISRLKTYYEGEWDPDAFIWMSDLFLWRIGAVVQPFLALAAVIMVLRGKLRPAAWLMLGYFLFEVMQALLRSIRYWP